MSGSKSSSRKRRSSQKGGWRRRPPFGLDARLLIPIAFLLVELGILLTSYVKAPRFFDNLTLFFGLILPGFFLLNAILVACFTRARPYVLAVSGLIAFVLIWPVHGLSPKPQSAPDLRIVSYNWLRNNPNLEPFLVWMRSETPDVVVIQEVPQVLKAHLAALSDIFPYVSRGKADDVLILSRYPFRNETSTPVGKQDIVTVEIEAPGGPVSVYGLHAPTLHTQSQWLARNEFLTIATGLIDDKEPRIVVAGDFNTSYWSPYWREFKSQNNLSESAEVSRTPTRIISRLFGYRIGGPIDHILTRPENTLSNCRTGPAIGSDHLPVICDLWFYKGK